MKVVLNTLGCKLNQAETESLTWQLIGAGHLIVNNVKEADVFILNTCTVTAIADAKSRQLIRQALSHNPQASIIVCGCYAEREKERLEKIPGVSLVIDNASKSRLPSLLEDNILQKDKAFFSHGLEQRNHTRTRSFIKIQEGCNKHCSYCIVPMVRGREKSVPLPQVLQTVRERLSEGYRETVLTGTNVGAYNDDGNNLRDLIRLILEETPVSRIRLSSLQPQEITPELISLWRNERLCPHFHLSLQSGSDNILHRMQRQYSLRQYKDSVSLIRSIIPEASITTDIIVGFPGETEDDFERSYLTCKDLQFARIHVFPFSPRPGTEAAQMRGKVQDNVKKERCLKMLALAEDSSRNYRALFLGKTRPVLWESRRRDGAWHGLTDNYLPVKAYSDENLSNQIKMTVIQ
jgi:threonylcarbamoyladenosine tRNA methylthiotransferase MtaB